MEFLLLTFLLALIPAAIAASKDRNPFVWYVYALPLFIIALPHSIFLHPRHLCPACLEKVSSPASICPHCHSRLSWPHDSDGPHLNS